LLLALLLGEGAVVSQQGFGFCQESLRQMGVARSPLSSCCRLGFSPLPQTLFLQLFPAALFFPLRPWGEESAGDAAHWEGLECASWDSHFEAPFACKGDGLGDKR